VQNPRASNDDVSLRKLCNSLTLSRRIRQRRLGPFSVHPRSRGRRARQRQRKGRQRANAKSVQSDSDESSDASFDDEDYGSNPVYDDFDYPYLCEERYFHSGCDFEMDRDVDPSQWEPYCDMVERATEEARGGRVNLHGFKPKVVPFSSLYPDCEFVTNRTLSSGLPTRLLAGRNSPLKLVYC
jgi:hypothetical protein